MASRSVACPLASEVDDAHARGLVPIALRIHACGSESGPEGALQRSLPRPRQPFANNTIKNTTPMTVPSAPATIPIHARILLVVAP
jgi:hypothetical protein